MSAPATEYHGGCNCTLNLCAHSVQVVRHDERFSVFAYTSVFGFNTDCEEGCALNCSVGGGFVMCWRSEVLDEIVSRMLASGGARGEGDVEGASRQTTNGSCCLFAQPFTHEEGARLGGHVNLI